MGEAGGLQMHVVRKNAALGYAGEHRSAPRIAAQQPIALRAKKSVIPQVASHPLVKLYLRHQRHGKIVRAANEWHADAIRISLCPAETAFDAVTIIIRENFFEVVV